MKKQRGLNSVNLIICIVFIIAILFMSFGYASLSSTLTIGGNLAVKSYGKVYISNIQMIEQEFINATGEVRSYSEQDAVLPVSATDTIFSATYLITLTSLYSRDVAFSGISLIPHVTSGSGSVDHYVEITNNADGSNFYPGSIIPAKSDVVLKMKIYYTSDSVVTITTEMGVIVLDEENLNGSLSKGTIDKNTATFNDDIEPVCYNVDFINSYPYENVVNIKSSNTNYKIVKSNGHDLGNVTIPANSTQTVNYCLQPQFSFMGGSDSTTINYTSYSSGETFNDNISITLISNKRTLAMSTNFDDGQIICNNVTLGANNIINTVHSATAIVRVGDIIECSVGDGNARASNKEYVYNDGYGNITDLFYDKWTIVDDPSNYERYIELELTPTLAGTYKNTNNAQAASDTLVNKRSGYYLVEIWGGDGGNGYNYSNNNLGGTGGVGGYLYGAVYLNYDQSIAYSLGGDGNKGVGSDSTEKYAGGANGGGMSSYNNDFLYIGGSGGGYSSLIDSTNNVYLFIAAGGGGGAGPGGSSGGQKGGWGGSGGTMNSQTASYNNGTVFYGENGKAGANGGSKYGTGGTTSGGTNTEGKDYMVGALLQGGHAKGRGGGGGAGFYGGGGGYSAASDNKGLILGHAYTFGGGGGSSYIYSSVRYNGLPSDVLSHLVGKANNPSENGGALILTYLGKTLD